MAIKNTERFLIDSLTSNVCHFSTISAGIGLVLFIYESSFQTTPIFKYLLVWELRNKEETSKIVGFFWYNSYEYFHPVGWAVVTARKARTVGVIQGDRGRLQAAHPVVSGPPKGRRGGRAWRAQVKL
jgi:hypothetical protein